MSRSVSEQFNDIIRHEYDVQDDPSHAASVYETLEPAGFTQFADFAAFQLEQLKMYGRPGDDLAKRRNDLRSLVEPKLNEFTGIEMHDHLEFFGKGLAIGRVVDDQYIAMTLIGNDGVIIGEADRVTFLDLPPSDMFERGEGMMNPFGMLLTLTNPALKADGKVTEIGQTILLPITYPDITVRRQLRFEE